MEYKDLGLDWDSLGEETPLGQKEEEMLYNPDIVDKIQALHICQDIRQLMYPEDRDSNRPAILNDIEAFRYGLKIPDSIIRNLTKSTLTRILKNFVDFGSLPDSLFVLGNVKFLTEIFDVEEVRQQVRAYLSSPYTIKSDDFVIALNYMLNGSLGLTYGEKQIVLELLRFISK